MEETHPLLRDPDAVEAGRLGALQDLAVLIARGSPAAAMVLARTIVLMVAMSDPKPTELTKVTEARALAKRMQPSFYEAPT